MTIKQFLIQISSVLDKLKINYVVSGGVAVTTWGKPRFTADVDIVIEIDNVDQVKNLTIELKRNFPKSYPDIQMAVDAFERKSEFNVIEPEFGFKADFFISDNTEYRKLEIKRGRSGRLNNKMIRFISPEDLIINKLIWYKEGQSTRQLEDIQSVIEAREDLDQEYLQTWIKKLDLEAEWQELKELK